MLSDHPGTAFRNVFADIDLGSSSAIISAVSGGSDSTALLFLLNDHIKRHAPHCKLVAVTVDHGLRTESAREAEAVAQLCRAHGIDHDVRSWSGEKPATGLAAASRDARYRLLTEAARRYGAAIVVTGHTADDQAETVLMRQARGDGLGIAGMARLTLLDGDCWLLRPLLGVRRAELRDYLAARGQDWIDDPSNINQRYERPRIRAALNDTDDMCFAAALASSAVVAARRMELGHEAAMLLRAYADRPSPGLIRLDPKLLDASPEAATHLVRILLACIGGTPRLVDQPRVAALLGAMKTADSRKPFRATMSRSVIDRRASGIFLYRETRNLPQPQPAKAMIWDGRYRLAGNVDLEDLTIAAIGNAEAGGVMKVENGVPESLARAALSAQPALWRSDKRVPDAGLGSPENSLFQPVLAPWLRFLPGFDLEAASAAAELLGAAALPQPPCADHIACKA
ncbi:tRNA lysidine(34) synthetase TilS [Oryzicola mucosus]|uniref:tRNA(Ile)-lysidine synthase n=1 Tax=Oryzicola mucosus TaxID=2767425 RepID=A0A8J6PSF0_9HYPH|nr:tRNA lysidine(34) synthetase TilS [Oryzicola mucosus]MBD0414239.1 tRNA lysidine(34) synthetase TilS [Oryzicola mucosus]